MLLFQERIRKEEFAHDGIMSKSCKLQAIESIVNAAQLRSRSTRIRQTLMSHTEAKHMSVVHWLRKTAAAAAAGTVAAPAVATVSGVVTAGASVWRWSSNRSDTAR